MNSNKLAIAVTLAVAAVRMATSFNLEFVFFYAGFSFGLFLCLIPIADLVTGQEYIRTWRGTLMKKVNRNEPRKYALSIINSSVGILFFLYAMFVGLK